MKTNEGNLDRYELNQLTVFQKAKEVSWAGQAGKITARKSCRSVEVIVTAGGCDNSAILESVCCFIPAVGKWMDLSPMKIPRWRYCTHVYRSLCPIFNCQTYKAVNSLKSL